jgi:hypothetical protein
MRRTFCAVFRGQTFAFLQLNTSNDLMRRNDQNLSFFNSRFSNSTILYKTKNLTLTKRLRKAEIFLVNVRYKSREGNRKKLNFHEEIKTVKISEI